MGNFIVGGVLLAIVVLVVVRLVKNNIVRKMRGSLGTLHNKERRTEFI